MVRWEESCTHTRQRFVSSLKTDRKKLIRTNSLMTLTHHEQPDWPPVCTYQHGGRGKGQTWVLHAAVGERWRENQDVILTPNIRSSQFLSCLQHGFGLKDKEHPNITPASLCPACSTFFCVLMLYMFVCFTCSHIFMFVCSHVLCLLSIVCVASVCLWFSPRRTQTLLCPQTLSPTRLWSLARSPCQPIRAQS